MLSAFFPAAAVEAGPRYGKPVKAGQIKHPGLDEVSGIVASRSHPGLYWVHNDSGSDARIFAIREDGSVVTVVKVKGAEAKDWEDIAIGPGPEVTRHHLYIADTGNNRLKRRHLSIYRLPEPRLDPADAPAAIESGPVERFRFRYPRRSFDCEAIVVHPAKMEVYLFTKRILGIDAYRLDVTRTDARILDAEHVRFLREGRLATAAALSPDGRRLALRFYWGICEYRSDDGPVLDKLGQRPQWIGSPPELQGEALCYGAAGDRILTIGEGKEATVYVLKEP